MPTLIRRLWRINPLQKTLPDIFRRIKTLSTAENRKTGVYAGFSVAEPSRESKHPPERRKLIRDGWPAAERTVPVSPFTYFRTIVTTLRFFLLPSAVALSATGW